MLILNVISITFGLMKSLYYAEDNKVLATLPVNSNGLFYSKLVVYYLFQLKKDLGILIPVTLGFVIFLVSKNVINIGAAFWCIIPLFFLSIIILLVSALLSVPVLYIYRFIKQYPLMELILLLALMAAGVVVIILLINLIPQDIDLVNQWPAMRNDLKEAMANFSHHNVVVTFVVRTMFGYQTMSDVYRFALIGRSFINLAILIGVATAIGAVVYFAIKPLYFSMMTKSFEFDKNLIDQPKKNVKHKKYVTFANKELKISFRDIEISGTYLVVYIATPILLFFMDKVFMAISTRLEGDIMTYAFNILLIALPFLASNSAIATIYSKEGRAAYIKKTKPINPLFPLTSKVLFNLILSVPSILACAIVFAWFSQLGAWVTIMLGLSILLLQYGHILYSASLDIMNPQNEVYATDGEQNNNPNENKATVVAFITSGLYALISYFFMTESYSHFENFYLAFIKLLLIAIAFFGSTTLLFVLKVKAYYYEK